MVILLGSGRCTVLKSCGGVTANNDLSVCCVSTVNSAPAPPYAAAADQ